MCCFFLGFKLVSKRTDMRKEEHLRSQTLHLLLQQETLTGSQFGFMARNAPITLHTKPPLMGQQQLTMGVETNLINK